MNAKNSTMPLWSIVFGLGLGLALSVPTDADADLVAPELSTHTPDIVLLSDGPFAIDPERHYLNVHSLTWASVVALSGSPSPPRSSGASGSGGGASGGGGGGAGRTDDEQQGLDTRAATPAALPFPTVILAHEIPEDWATAPVAPPGAKVPQIPIPSAAVLFGSALLGLIGFRLRAPRKRL